MQLHQHYPNVVTSRVCRSEDVCTAEKVYGFPDECVYLRPLGSPLSGSRALNGVITVRELPYRHAPSVQPVSIQEEQLRVSLHCPPVDVTERRHN